MHSNPIEMVSILLGTASPLKIEAVQLSYPNATVKGINFPSIVSEQPVGKEESQEGAQYRAEEARRREPGHDLYFGIENGMYNKTGNNNDVANWVDIGCVVIIDARTNTTEVLWSEELPIPEKKVKKAIKDGKAVRTWSMLKDPHAKLSGKTRKLWLHETIEKRTK